MSHEAGAAALDADGDQRRLINWNHFALFNKQNSTNSIEKEEENNVIAHNACLIKNYQHVAKLVMICHLAFI